jgi:DNA-binding response OmpR family regulator
MNERVLVVDDDEVLGKVVALSLQKEGFQVQLVLSGPDGLRAAYDNHPQLIILDVMMPRLDGWETCRRLKEMSNVPILMLTARVTESDVLKGFECGADDYLRKPFSLAELNARCKALLKRAEPTTPDARPSLLRSRDLELDLARHRATLAGKPLELTPTEFRLLSYFMQNPGKLIPHKELLSEVWGPEYAEEDQYLRLYIRYLRQKLKDNPSNPTYIFNVRGEGYRFCEG